MNWPTRILGIFVLVTVASLVAVVSRQNLLTPRQVLEDVQAEMQGESFDEQALLRRLASSIRRAEAGDLSLPATRELCADLRTVRGRLYLDIGATREARADFESVLENYLPGDREIRRLLIRAESQAGDVDTALAHLEELLIEQPDFGSAMVEKGHLHQELAQEALERCDEKLRFALVETDAEKASEILRTLASRDPSDPARATIILELKELFPASADESLGQVLGFCEEASGHLTECRESYVKSFSLGLDPVALTRYLDILDNAGRTDEALRLGSIVALEGPERADPDSAVLLIRMLMDRGNYEHAAELTTRWVEGDPPLNAEFLRLGCEALWRAEKWAGLSRVSYKLRSIGSLDDEVICAFYTGYSQANASKPRLDKALIALMDFATSRTPEPFKGAREQAWREIARLQGDRQQLSREREAIQAALDLDPLLAGALWLRRAEIQLETPHNGYRLPLESWTQGMRLAPRRTEELLPRFEELGKKTLQAEERNIDVIFEDLKRENRKFPTRDYGPYVLYRIAQMHGEEENWSGQLAASQRLLDKFPDFLAALDLAIDARGNLGDREKYIDLVLHRVDLAGMDERAQALVDSIRIDEYTNPQLVRMMQNDPRNTGRMVVTRWYYENGETAAAIETLESNSKSTRTDEETLFGTQVLMADGDYRTALRWLDEIEERSPIHKIKLRLAVSCAMSLGKTDEILTRLAALLAEEELGPHEILLLADMCLRVDQPQATQLLLGRIAPGDLEDPGDLRRRDVILALRLDESKQASAMIERSAAFLSEAEYLVSRLLLDAAEKDWSRATRNAVDLRKTELIQKPLVDVLIDLIAGDSKRAFDNTQFALQLTPLVPKWIIADNIARLGLDEELRVPPAYGAKARADMDAFLNGRGRDIIDPRTVAVLLIASELEGFDPLVLAALNSMESTDRGSLWRQTIKADLQSETGDNTGAIPTYELVLRSHSDCLPAWDALEAAKIKHHSSASHPQVVSVRNRRMLSLAEADPEGAAGLLVSSKRLVKKGDLQAALRMTLRAQQLAPQWFEARIAVAQLYSELGHWEPALEEWRSLVEGRNPAEVTRSVAGYIRALSRASVTDPPVIRMSEIKAELDALDKKLPDDPRVVLALAHIDLMIDENNPAFGLERAWSRLRTLRDKFEGISLEEMRRGATQAWSKFYVDTDPDSAEEFILSELHRQPGNLYLWRLLGRVYRDLGRFDESIDVLNRVALMVPSEEVQMELATSYAALGADPKVVSKVVSRAKQLRAGGGDSLEGQLLIAEALLSTFGAKEWGEAITLLEAVWEARHELEVPALRTKLASLYGRALLLRGEPGDARRAVNVLTQELINAEIPYEHEFFTCLMGLGRSFDNVRE